MKRVWPASFFHGLAAYNEYVANRGSYIQNALNAVLPYDWNKIAQKSIQEYSRLIS